MKTKINRWSLKSASVFLAVIELTLFATPGFAQITVNLNEPDQDSYPTLRAAFARINDGTHTGGMDGVITISVVANTDPSETMPAVLNASGMGSASYGSISITPNGAWTISGNIAGQPLIDLNGSDNVMINGLNTPGNSLTISNISSTLGANTIQFRNDATDNLITRCTILGSSTSSAANPGATINFSTGTTTGNDRNTISLCNIGPADPLHPPTQAIRGSGSTSSNAIRNNEVHIDNNNIYDFFGTGKTNTTGITILSGNDNWTISDNRIYQRVPRTFTVAGRYAGILVSTAAPLGAFTITGNRIGFGEADGTGTTSITGTRGGLQNTFRGIEILSVSTAVVTTIQGNTISGIRQTAKHNDLNTPVFIGVNMSNFVFNDDLGGLIHAIGNTIGSLDGTLHGSLPSSIVIDSASTRSDSKTIATVRGFSNFTEQATTISDNEIGAITIQGPPAIAGMLGFDGIYVNPNANVRATISNNIIGGTLPNGAITNTQTGNYVMTGIRTQKAQASPMSGNLVRNMTTYSNGALLGIICGAEGFDSSANTITQNTVHSLSNASATGGSVFGMKLTFRRSRNSVTRNFIHSLSITAATGTLVGIEASFSQSKSKATYANNMVDLGTKPNGMPVSEGLSVVGIRERDSEANPTNGMNGFVFNSVYVGGAGSGVANSYAFISEKQNTPGSTLRNNIFWNERSHAGPGKNYAIAIARTGGLTSNFNDLRVNLTPGVTGLTGLVINPPRDLPTLAAWRLFTGQDMSSIDLDPLFMTPIGTAETVDLHVLPGTPVQAMATTSSITNDFDNDLRPTPPLRPDIGADEIPCSATSMFPNSATITIPDPDLIPSDGSGNATPYPSIVTVAGLGLISSTTGSVQVTIHQFTHTAPDDVGIVLVGPTSAALLVQDGAGDNTGMGDVTYTLSDPGAMQLPDVGAWIKGTYKPTNYYFPLDIFPEVMEYGNPGPAGAGMATFAVFNGTNPNGDWKLYVRDFARQDVGFINAGWTLILTTDLACPPSSALASATPTSSRMPTPNPSSTSAAIPTTAAVPTMAPVATATVAATPGPTAAETTTPAITPRATPAPTPAETATSTPLPTTQTINLSTRLRVQTGDNVGIAGFVIAGSAPKQVLVRAIGPSLAQSGISDSLADPVLDLHGPGAFRTISNDNWKDTLEATIQGTGVPPANDFESAINATLAPGAYTAIVRGNGNTSGVALVEVYDLNEGVASKLANLSTRAFVSTGDNIVIAGFLLSNNATDDRIVVRGIGPSLSEVGVSNPLADPTLELRNSNGALLVTNNDWQDNPEQAAELVAAGLAPTNQLESGIAATLPPGLYTALLAGLDNGTGVGLVEVYDRGAP